MSDITKNIVSVCHELIKKPGNIITNNDDEYLKEVDSLTTIIHKAGFNPKYASEANRAIVLDSIFYNHVKKNITIKLIENLFLENINRTIEKEVYDILHKEDQFIKTGVGKYRIAMQIGDIKIKLINSDIFKNISENKINVKEGLLIKGEESYITTEKEDPQFGRQKMHYSLIAATQDDLSAILNGLTEIL